MNDAEGNINADMTRLKEACDNLCEHFDTIQIFATRVQDKTDGEEGTVSVTCGNGNWFARRGQIADWMIAQDAETRKNAERDDD